MKLILQNTLIEYSNFFEGTKMYATIKTLPKYFPEILVQRIIISVLAFEVFCIVMVILYKCRRFDKVQCIVAVLLSMYIVVMRCSQHIFARGI